MNQQEKQPLKDKNVSNEKEKKSFSEKLADFIRANRVLILSIGIAIVVAIVAIGLYTSISDNVATASSRAMDLADQKIQQWSQETDEQKKTEEETALIAEFDTIAKKWPGTLAAQRALLRKAAILSQKKEYAEAEKIALDAYSRKKNSYAAALALELAAVSAEEAGNIDSAITHYTLLTKNYSKDNPTVAHAYFNLGRLQESKKEFKAAIANYEKILSAYGNSDWALLAKNRIIYLKSQGLLN